VEQFTRSKESEHSFNGTVSRTSGKSEPGDKRFVGLYVGLKRSHCSKRDGGSHDNKTSFLLNPITTCSKHNEDYEMILRAGSQSGRGVKC
jgi:hypothetical protein